MKLRKLAAVASFATIAVLPVVAHATAPVSCSSPTSRDAGGDPGTPAPTRVGVCLQGSGYVEAGTDGTHVYVVISSDTNGYVGVSSYSSTADSDPCTASTPDGNEGGSGTNAGGCYGTNTVLVNLRNVAGTGVDATAGGLVPLPVCGDNTGAWYNSSRNGCRADNEDVNQGVAKALAALTCIAGNPANLPACVL
jgi:hypothetical protein